MSISARMPAGDFKPFGYYRIVLGIVVIAYFLLAR